MSIFAFFGQHIMLIGRELVPIYSPLHQYETIPVIFSGIFFLLVITWFVRCLCK